MIDEGYIKFRLHHREAAPPSHPELASLIRWRNRLHALGLIGHYEEHGVGYGNISLRHPEGFVISGTQTGHIAEAGAEHFTLVTGWDIPANSVHSAGPIQASSESMTHAMLYDMDPAIGGVIHIHHGGAWRALLHQVPTTDEQVPYGTPEMAGEIARLWNEGELPQGKLLVMAGHEEGIFSFGKGLQEAAAVLRPHFPHWQEEEA